MTPNSLRPSVYESAQQELVVKLSALISYTMNLPTKEYKV